MRQVLDTGEPAQRSTYRRVPGETREHAWSVSVSPLKDQAGRTQAVWIGVLDITEQYQARQRLTLLNEAGTHVGTTLDVTRTAQELADIVVPRLADLAIVDLLEAVLSGDEPRPGPLAGTIALRRVAHQSIFEGVPEAVVKPGDVDIYPESFPSARCLATGQTVLTGVDDPTFISSTGHNPARAAIIRQFGIHSVLSVPIRARGVTLGVAVFLRGQRPDPFEQDDLLLAEELTARAGLSLDNARRYTRERTTALTLQRSLLPQRLARASGGGGRQPLPARQCPARRGRRLVRRDPAVRRPGRPGRRRRRRPRHPRLRHHGPAAHRRANPRRRRPAARRAPDPPRRPGRPPLPTGRPSTDADDGDDAENDIGATCLYAVYDPVSRRCSLARAGHPPPALVTPDGTASFLDLPAGPPLGLGGLPFESSEVELPAGSILALYTDGLIESRDDDIDLGLERLRRALTYRDRSLETTCDTSSRPFSPIVPRTTSPCSSPAPTPWTTDQVATWDLPADPAIVAAARRQVAERLDELGSVTMRRSPPSWSSANSSPTRSATHRARSSSASSATGRLSARSPTAAAPLRTCAGPAPSTKAAAACSWSPSSPSAGAPARPRMARPSGPNKPFPVPIPGDQAPP